MKKHEVRKLPYKEGAKRGRTRRARCHKSGALVSKVVSPLTSEVGLVDHKKTKLATLVERLQTTLHLRHFHQPEDIDVSLITIRVTQSK